MSRLTIRKIYCIMFNKNGKSISYERKKKTMTRLEDFAKTCAEFLTENDRESMEYGYDATYRNAMENPCDLWDYLWWLNTEYSRGICMEYWDVIA